MSRSPGEKNVREPGLAESAYRRPSASAKFRTPCLKGAGIVHVKCAFGKFLKHLSPAQTLAQVETLLRPREMRRSSSRDCGTSTRSGSRKGKVCSASGR